jgi:hypothetical protein
MSRALQVSWLLAGCLVLVSADRAPATLELDARNGPPVLDVVAGGRAMRLEVEPDLGPGVALNRNAPSARGIRPALTRNVTISIRDGPSIRGRLAATRIVLADGVRLNAPVGLYALTVSQVADGVVGLSALPHDIITIQLGAREVGEVDLQMPLTAAGGVFGRIDRDGDRIGLAYRFRDTASVLNVRATRMLEAEGKLVPRGTLVNHEVVLGLRTSAQPVTTDFRPRGLDLGNTLAETNAPLEGAPEPGTVIVIGSRTALPPPRVALGRQALRACSRIVIDRRRQLLTLSCRLP